MADSLGKYCILAEIGKGGFATVYRALDNTLDREVALKVLDPVLARDPTWVARFQREAKAVARLNHSHIVTIHEIGESESRLYIAMELIEGPSLAQRIAAHGRLAWGDTLKILGQVAAALDYAHGQGVLHRDLKPANILLDPRTGAVLTDFGFARLVGESSMSVSLSGGVVGTPAYIAPEVWDGEEPTAQTDVYSLGCVAYEMLTGEVLFAGITPSVVMRQHLIDGPQWPETMNWPAGVPAGTREVLVQALAKAPTERYPSADEFVTALAASRLSATAVSIPSLAPTPGPPAIVGEETPEHMTTGTEPARRQWLILAAALVGLIALVLVLWALTRPTPPVVARTTPTLSPPTSISRPLPAAASTDTTTSVPLTSTSTLTAPATETASPVPSTSTLEPTRTAQPTGTAIATPSPAFTVKEGSAINVRSGPGTVYPVLGALQPGETRIVTGRTAAGDWWQFQYRGQPGWVSNQIVTVNQTVSAVAEAVIPPTPTSAPQIGFVSDREGTDEIYVMNIDGGNLRRLTLGCTNCKLPDWSPDGQRLAYESYQDGNGEIYIMGSDGSGQYNSTSHPRDDGAPAWSPDGKFIAFDSNRDGTFQIYVMNADGTGQRRLSSSSSDDVTPTWSPDGRLIAFHSYRDGNAEIYLMNADGTNTRSLTQNAAADKHPNWSPDGRFIIFDSDRGGSSEIYMMSLGGVEVQRLTTADGGNWRPAWLPQRNFITFMSARDGNNEIYVMSADGMNQVNITQHPASDQYPSWRSW